MSYIDRLRPEDVVDERTFASYVSQVLGTPRVTIQDISILRAKLKAIRKEIPCADWSTLVGIIHWAKARRRRPYRVWVVLDWVNYAWADGFLPELEPDQEDEELETAIQEALAVETHPEWRRRLRGSEGSARREVYEAWKQAHLVRS